MSLHQPNGGLIHHRLRCSMCHALLFRPKNKFQFNTAHSKTHLEKFIMSSYNTVHLYLYIYIWSSNIWINQTNIASVISQISLSLSLNTYNPHWHSLFSLFDIGNWPSVIPTITLWWTRSHSFLPRRKILFFRCRTVLSMTELSRIAGEDPRKVSSLSFVGCAWSL